MPSPARCCGSLCVLSAFLLITAASRPDRHVVTLFPHEVNTNILSVTLEPVGGNPEFVAVRISEEESSLEKQIEDFRALHAAMRTNRIAALKLPGHESPASRDPSWLPFKTNLLVDLGPGEGDRQIMFAFKYRGEPYDGGWSGSSVTIRYGTPSLWIVNPTNQLTSQPMIQLQGLTNRKFRTLRFTQFDAAGNKLASDDMGLGASFTGGYPFEHSDHHFTFFDVELSPGANTFWFDGTDQFGNQMRTNMTIIFSTAHDHTPPCIRLDWPRPNEVLSGERFTVRGRMDDFTAALEGSIRTSAGSKSSPALVERNGCFWLEDIPLAMGENQICIVATDAAGNTSRTNFSVIGSDGPVVTMDPVIPALLWEPFIAATGRVTPPECDVWINGVQAAVQADGAWSAKKVPVLSPNGGTAVFQMTALPRNRNDTATRRPKPADILCAQTSLGTNAALLNASAPACGVFRLHITDALGRNFVILSSTNLVDWTPVLTNMSAPASLDYTFATTNEPCRFFKLSPLP